MGRVSFLTHVHMQLAFSEVQTRMCGSRENKHNYSKLVGLSTVGLRMSCSIASFNKSYQKRLDVLKDNTTTNSELEMQESILGNV